MDWDEIRQDITDIGIETFGKSATSKFFIPKAGGSIPIDGIVTRDWVEVQMGAGLPVSGMQTVMDINLAQLPAMPVAGDKVVVSEVEYKIMDCQPDGGGGARLVLQK
jgi:hypothetical protein